jgi:minor extracellular serine protease Vpr
MLKHSRVANLSDCVKRKRGSIPCEHKLDSRRVVYDPTGHRPVGSLRPTFVGMTKPEDWFLHSLSALQYLDSGSAVLGKFHAMTSMVDKNTGMYKVIVYYSNLNDALQVGVQPNTVTRDFFTTSATLDQIARLSMLGSVRYMALAKKYKPLLDKSVHEIHADQLRLGTYNNTSYTGKHVILGFVDTGIDWKHLDFRDTTTKKSRILWIWDQLASGIPPSGFSIGTEYTQAQIDSELGSTPPGVVKEVDSDGHGTHVAGIAAGNGSSSASGYIGVAPDADIVFVKTTFQDVDIINGITYIKQKAVSAGEPFVINLSLGSQDGAHDGTSADEEAIDAVLADTGCAIVVAAGNEGTDQIHADSTVLQGGSASYKFTIPAYTPSKISQNDYVYFDIWYGAEDKLTVAVTSPNGSVATAISGELVSTQTPAGDGQVEIDNASQGLSALNGAKECLIVIFDAVANKPPRAGTWQIKISGASVAKEGGAYDIWLSDASMSGADGSSPEFTSGYSFRKLVGSPGTSKKAITVGSYETKFTWPSIELNNSHQNKIFTYTEGDRVGNYSTFSSMGPTRDGRQKPEICAPGQAIVSVLSKDSSPDSSDIDPDGKHVVMQGTSMAAPHVAGVAALMLQGKPFLTSDQLKNVITSSARRDAFTGSAASPQWGYGKIDATGSMGTVLSVRQVSDALPKNFSLEQNYPNPFNPSTQIRYTLPQNFKGTVSLTVFDVLGKKVATLVNEQKTEGTFAASWNAASSASGVYFCILRAGSFFDVKKMILMK